MNIASIATIGVVIATAGYDMILHNVNRICVVIVSVIASSVVGRGFELRSGKPKSNKLLFVTSPLSTQHWGERAKTGWLGIRIMCSNYRATCLSADCYFSQLALF